MQRNDNGTLPAFAWPGGYPLYYLDRQDSTLCPACANKSDTPEELEGFKPTFQATNWEDPNLDCDNCGARIPSAYAEDKKEA